MFFFSRTVFSSVVRLRLNLSWSISGSGSREVCQAILRSLPYYEALFRWIVRKCLNLKVVLWQTRVLPERLFWGVWSLSYEAQFGGSSGALVRRRRRPFINFCEARGAGSSPVGSGSPGRLINSSGRACAVAWPLCSALARAMVCPGSHRIDYPLMVELAVGQMS